MGHTVYVYGMRAFGEAAAQLHHPRIRERLAETVKTFEAGVRLVYRIDADGVHRLTTDPIEAHRLRKAYPGATIRVIPIQR